MDSAHWGIFGAVQVMAFSCVPFRQCTAMPKIIHTKWYLHTKSSHRLLRRRTHSLWDYRTMKSRTPPPNCSFLPSLLSFFANFYPNVQTEEIYQTFHTRHGAQMFPLTLTNARSYPLTEIHATRPAPTRLIRSSVKLVGARQNGGKTRRIEFTNIVCG